MINKDEYSWLIPVYDSVQTANGSDSAWCYCGPIRLNHIDRYKHYVITRSHHLPQPIGGRQKTSLAVYRHCKCDVIFYEFVFSFGYETTKSAFKLYNDF